MSGAVDVLAGLNPTEVEMLRQVQDGADVWAYGPARLLRCVQAKAPEAIRIVRAKERPAGHLRQPYFGAKATAAGKRALARIQGGTE